MIRKFARPLLASVFVADGVDTLINQQDHQEGARELVARVRSITPNQYLKYVPANEANLVRAVAATKVAAGSMYALGKAPRLAATALVAAQIPTILARHAFWETQEPIEKKARRSGFMTDLALLGGLFLATADTAGKPGLAWRAEKAGQQVNKKVQAALPTKSEQEKRAEEISESFKDAGETVKDKASSFRDLAAGAFERAQEYVEDNKDDWREQIVDFAEDAREQVSDFAEDAKEQFSGFADEAKKQAEKVAKR